MAFTRRLMAVLMADEERPHNVFDGGRSVSFSENDLGSVNVWEALCRRNHGASSLHPWNPRPRQRKPLPDVDRFSVERCLKPANPRRLRN